MHKLYIKLTVCTLAAAVFLTTGCMRQEEDTGAGYLFTCVLPGNPDCLDPQFTDNPNAAAVLDSMVEGLVRLDSSGNVVCAEAESYTVSDDGLTYMFNLRDDCYWYSVNSDPDRPERVTARDYVYAFRRLLDPATRSPYAEQFACIQNGMEIILGRKDVKHLGVSAPDATTVLFELDKPEPEFLSLLAQSCAAPCSESFFETTKGRYGLDTDTILCNGPFYPTKWNYDQYAGGNFITFRKNPVYHDSENIYPSSLQFTIMHNSTEARGDFADGNADIIFTDTDPKDFIRTKSCTVKSIRSETLGLVFHPENTLLQNDALRQALAYGIDRTALAELLSDDLEPAYGLIPPGVTMLGRSYRELYADEQLALPYEPETAQREFAEAAQELGLGAMNTLQIMVPSNILDTDAMLAVCQKWQDLFGYYIGIETVSPEEFDRRMAAGNYSIALCGFQPERNSCYAALQVFSELDTIPENADFGLLIKSLAKADNLSASIELYGAAEQAVIDSHAFIPLFYKSSYLVYTSGNEDIYCDPFSGALSLREAKHFD